MPIGTKHDATRTPIERLTIAGSASVMGHCAEAYKPMRQTEIQTEALTRAVSSQALTNYPTIYQGFSERGIPIEEIRPRENVFTFQAWKALGRYVRKGEHGVKVLTWIPIKEKTVDGEPETVGKRPRTTTVFHISQTEPIV